MDATIQQLLGMPGAFLVVLNTEGLRVLGAQVFPAFGQGRALASTGVDDAHLATSGLSQG
ncbi:MAG: hypothetical protein GY934_09240, partial [Gammaproteobacteria bacterium]|nr:hypothetical protein [Gammaproteobacteria bacterium]